MKNPIDIELRFRLVVLGEEVELINLLLFNNIVKLINKATCACFCAKTKESTRDSKLLTIPTTKTEQCNQHPPNLCVGKIEDEAPTHII